MAFKRSAVRSRLSPPKKLKTLKKTGGPLFAVFRFFRFLVFPVFWFLVLLYVFFVFVSALVLPSSLLIQILLIYPGYTFSGAKLSKRRTEDGAGQTIRAAQPSVPAFRLGFSSRFQSL